MEEVGDVFDEGALEGCGLVFVMSESRPRYLHRVRQIWRSDRPHTRLRKLVRVSAFHTSDSGQWQDVPRTPIVTVWPVILLFLDDNEGDSLGQVTVDLCVLVVEWRDVFYGYTSDYGQCNINR